jgi:ketosteroid isomerase-like protein
VKYAMVVCLFLLTSCGAANNVPPAASQRTGNADAELEKVLWDVNQQWLCSGPYQKPYKDCVEFRSRYWVDQFFEVIPSGELLNKDEMVATQTAAIPFNPAPGTGPYPDAFKLRAVYGDFAMATDHTNFKTADKKNGKLAFTSNAKVLRLFVKENGTWRPAAAGLVPVILPAGPMIPAKHSTAPPRKSPNEQLEKELAEADRAWMDSSDINKRVTYIAKLFTDQWFEILGWDPTSDTSKSRVLEILPKLAVTAKPGEGVVQDQFQLQAVFGDVALASDHRTRTWTNEKGQLVKTPHRSLLVFVKQNGEWKSAGASLTPILNQ